MRFAVVLLAGLCCGCATSSVVLPASDGKPLAAMLPLEGPLGAQATDFISEELAEKGIVTVERATVIPALAIGSNGVRPEAVQSFANVGATLGVKYMFVGTVSAERGPLYSFPHVNMTLRLIDMRSGQTRWLGEYGNSLWTSAISQQGDLQRGAADLAAEFIKSGGLAILTQDP